MKNAVLPTLNNRIRTFLVYGHDSKGRGVVKEVWAKDTAEAISLARSKYSDCKFNHANIIE